MNAEPEKLPDSVIDDLEVARCSCGLVFYAMDYALEHECLNQSPEGGEE